MKEKPKYRCSVCGTVSDMGTIYCYRCGSDLDLYGEPIFPENYDNDYNADVTHDSNVGRRAEQDAQVRKNIQLDMNNSMSIALRPSGSYFSVFIDNTPVVFDEKYAETLYFMEIDRKESYSEECMQNCAKVLLQLKNKAQQVKGCEIECVSITVPFEFYTMKRIDFIRKAAFRAGFRNVVKIWNDAVSAVVTSDVYKTNGYGSLVLSICAEENTCSIAIADCSDDVIDIIFLDGSGEAASNGGLSKGIDAALRTVYAIREYIKNYNTKNIEEHRRFARENHIKAFHVENIEEAIKSFDIRECYVVISGFEPEMKIAQKIMMKMGVTSDKIVMSAIAGIKGIMLYSKGLMGEDFSILMLNIIPRGISLRVGEGTPIEMFPKNISTVPINQSYTLNIKAPENNQKTMLSIIENEDGRDEYLYHSDLDYLLSEAGQGAEVEIYIDIDADYRTHLKLLNKNSGREDIITLTQ